MDRLEIESRLYETQLPPKPEREAPADFMAWIDTPYRPKWKLGWWEESELEISKAATKKSLDVWGSEPVDWLNVQRNQANAGDYLLTFKILKNKTVCPKWMYADFVIKMSPDDKGAYEKDFPYQAVQVHKKNYCPKQPFKITPEFKKAFNAAAIDYGLGKIMNQKILFPDNSLVEKIKFYWTK
jgi:hypothetical protein